MGSFTREDREYWARLRSVCDQHRAGLQNYLLEKGAKESAKLTTYCVESTHEEFCKIVADEKFVENRGGYRSTIFQMAALVAMLDGMVCIAEAAQFEDEHGD